MLTIKNRQRNLQFGGSNHQTRLSARAHVQNLRFRSFTVCDSFSWATAVLVLSLLIITCGCTPAGPKALIRGERLVEQGKYIEAIEKLKLATTVISTNAQAWNYLALAYHYSRQPDQAERTYRRALLINHDLSEAHYNLGCLYLEQRKNDAAKTEFIAYTLRRANSLDGLLKLGTAQLRLAELTAAEKTFQDALRLSPQNPEALNGLGCIRAHQRGRATEAAGYFRAALKAQTNYSPALLNWAIVADQQSQDKRFALQKYREYICLKPPPENVQAARTAALELEQELNPPRSISSNRVQITTNFVGPKPAPTNAGHLASAQKSDVSANPPFKAPPDPSAKLATNKSQPVIAQPPPANTDVVKLAAEPVVKRAQDISPLSGQNAQLAGRGNSSTETGSAHSPARVQAEQLLAEGRRAQQGQRFKDAIKSYRAATQQDPTYFEAFYNLALALGESGDVTAATAAYQSALAIRPDSVDARYNLALVLKQGGDFTRAATEFEGLLEQNPGDTRSHLALANLYAQQLHEPAKARQHYLKVLEIDPHNSQASSIRFWLTGNP